MSAFGGSDSNLKKYQKLNNQSYQNHQNNNFNNTNNNGFNDPRRTGGPKKPFSKPSGFVSEPNGKKSNPRKKGSRPPSSMLKSELPILNDPLDIPTKIIPSQTPVKLQSYSPEELLATGQLFDNPESFGFKRGSKRIAPRPVPKYLLTQPRLLYTPANHPNAWDRQNQDRMTTLEQANLGLDYQGLYEEFQKMREVERKQMESLGLVDAENISKDLNDAIVFQGSCLDMCPVFERVRRALENNVKAFEKDPTTNKISKDRAVKAFLRPAAGQPSPLPSEVRPPHILVQSLDYLVENMVHQLPEAHSFIWDRTRSIRQDFTYQNSFGPEAIDCNERIVRIHLLSLHIMGGSEVEYSQQQELEQFNKALQTLTEIYQDVRNHGGIAPNEPEFRAYHLLSHIRDPELEREIQTLPNSILQDKNVQLALRLRSIISQNNILERGYINSVGAMNMFVEFFRIIYSDETPFLMACLLETHFNEIRFYALKSMTRSYHTKGRAYSAQTLLNILGFDSLEKLTKFVTYYEIDLVNENGDILVDLFNKDKLESKYKLNSVHDKAKLSPTYSSQIDRKIQGKSIKEFVNSGYPNHDLKLKYKQAVIEQAPLVLKKKSILPTHLNTELPVSQTFGQPIQNSQTFGQSTQNSQGFGQPNQNSKSFGQPIQNSQTFGQPIQKPQVPQNTFQAASFGSTGNNNAFQSSASKPQYSFSQNAASVNQPTIKNSETYKQTEKTQFSQPEKKLFSQPDKSVSPGIFKQTDSSQSIPSVESKLPTIPSSKPSNNFSLGNSIPPPTTNQNSIPKLTFGTPKIEPIQENKTPKVSTTVSIPTKVAPVPKKMLSDSRHFNQAAKLVFDEILSQTINLELAKILPKFIQVHTRIHERQQIIESLSNELYHAFMSEVTYKASLESKADFTYKQNLKIKAIRKLISIGTTLKQRQESKRKKLEELNSISFKIPKLKRRLSNESTLSVNSKRRFTLEEQSPARIYERQREVQDLWAPFDLSSLLKSCSENFKLKIESQDVSLKFLFVVENWASGYSKWLNTKFSLQPNQEKHIYEHCIRDDKVVLNFTSLPGGNYLNKDFFSATSFILFECGLTTKDTKYKNLAEKLKKDQVILEKIVSLVEKFSFYKVQLMLVYWDASNCGLSSQEATSILKLEECLKNENVQDISFCDMTVQDGNINEILVNGFNSIKNNFKGVLTARGTKKQEKLHQIHELNKRLATKAKESSLKTVQELPGKKQTSKVTIEQSEAKLLNRARKSRAYDYLNGHLKTNIPSLMSPNTTVANRSMLSYLNRSRINSMNQSMNNSFAQNNSINNSMNNLLAQNSFNSNNSFANTTFNNVSILTGFGKSMVEESTPFSSPKSDSKRLLPQSIQQLRDLTVGIKERYKKT